MKLAKAVFAKHIRPPTQQVGSGPSFDTTQVVFIYIVGSLLCGQPSLYRGRKWLLLLREVLPDGLDEAWDREGLCFDGDR
jgi:hypothetical protein